MNTTIRLRRVPFFSIAALAGFLCFVANAADTAKTDSTQHLVIVKAIYGDPNDSSATSDVTKQLNAAIKNDSIELRVSADNFDDPASGANKVLKVDYTIDGVAGKKTVWENGLLRLSVADKPDTNKKPSTKLIIRKAVYGDIPDAVNDVTDDVKNLVKDDSLTVKANSDDFGDPAGGRPKKLQVDYTLNGKDGSKTVAEGETLTVP